MCRVICRVLGLVGTMLLLAVVPCAASAVTPQGPRLASIALEETRSSKKGDDAGSPVMSLRTIDPLGGLSTQLLSAKLDGRKERVVPSPFYAPSWFPDGSLIAFAGSAAKVQRIYLVSADGSGARAIPGTKGGANPVISPDGHTIAFSRTRFSSHIDIKHLGRSRTYSSTTTWLADLSGGKPRRLTRWRNRLYNTPSSFSPDGSVLALTKSDDNLDGPRVVLMRLDGGGSIELVQLAEEPKFSPDGSKIAFVSYQDRDIVHAEGNEDFAVGELYAMRADGSEVRRLTRSDDVRESAPSWDPSGERIAYLHDRASTGFLASLDLLFPVGNAIMQVNADGTCRSRILSLRKVALYGAAWQPGPGRQAGPIICS
jgi:dipeptidyl aminopeptidase/acylaminoacyl peptidase